MEKLRSPLQGVRNIIRFNYHFYIAIVLLCICLYLLKLVVPYSSVFLFTWIIYFLLVITGVSLMVSFYIYDYSNLYSLTWLPDDLTDLRILNIHAGFDETSELLKNKYPKSEMKVIDFYNPEQHTEISIKRARKAYPAYPNTIQSSTTKLPIESESIDRIFIIFSAHEIRSDVERIIFFQELYRVLKMDGEVYVTEHLRDLPNFIAYNIGFFHFLSRDCWYNTFSASNLNLQKEQKLNPFISNYTLKKYDITS